LAGALPAFFAGVPGCDGRPGGGPSLSTNHMVYPQSMRWPAAPSAYNG
jgi:hypothetical protein